MIQKQSIYLQYWQRRYITENSAVLQRINRVNQKNLRWNRLLVYLSRWKKKRKQSIEYSDRKTKVNLTQDLLLYILSEP